MLFSLQMLFVGRFVCRRLRSTSVDLGAEVKRLNDTQQYREAIAHFDRHAPDQKESLSALVINQTLKACIALADFPRASEIHRSLSSQLLKNIYIRNSLIRLYGM